METLVIYDTKFGNTERIARAIASGAGAHGSARAVHTSEAAASLARRPGLVVIGGPTQRRGPSGDMRQFLDGVSHAALDGAVVGAFDTRYRGTTLIMGSAAAEIAKRLAKAGARPVARPESFFMVRKGRIEDQTLEAGELERAETWGREIAAAAAGAGVVDAVGAVAGGR